MGEHPLTPPARTGINPEFSSTAVIDLKGLLGTIKKAKGELDHAQPMEGEVTLLDIFAAEAESLRESRAEPEKIMPILLDKLGWSHEDPLGMAAIRTSEMAGENQDNHPSYHSPHHVTEVIMAAYVLGMREHLPQDRIVELLVAAAAHDMGHTGGMNQFAYELETLAYQTVYPVLVECELEEVRIERIGRMIASTDFANGVPMVRAAYRHYHDCPPHDEERMLAAQCVILTEADVLFPVSVRVIMIV
ncbi:MAG: 3',5'-cyclic nucleotide phosphodiesterase [Blastochloris sp.]|nr:3',5'-cyclic nucleotide phosphodiesterase [Blastochloris sp.]